MEDNFSTGVGGVGGDDSGSNASNGGGYGSGGNASDGEQMKLRSLGRCSPPAVRSRGLGTPALEYPFRISALLEVIRKVSLSKR